MLTTSNDKGEKMTRKIIVFVFIYMLFLIDPYPILGYQEQKIPVLMYHHIQENINNNTVISPENFDNQIRALKEAGYQAISTQTLYDYLTGQTKLPSKPVLITFDDGYLSNYEKAYPILKKYKMHAEIFVIASRISNDNYPNEIAKMTWEQLKDMQDYITIQSHTWDLHYKLPSNNGKRNGVIYGPSYMDGQLEPPTSYEKRVRNDLLQSKKIIKEQLGYEPIAISYPFGDYSDATIQLVKEAGFKMGFAIHNKSVIAGDHPYMLSRIIVNGNDSGATLLHKLKVASS